MKYALYYLFLLPAALPGQSPESAVCSNPQAQIDLDGNSLRARLLAAGDFGWDLNDAYYLPDFNPAAPTPATIFLGGLWYGGIDPAGDLVLKATTYRNADETSFYTGPLTETGLTDEFTCANWDRHFRVTATQIAEFLDDLADGTLSAPHNAVRGWPGRGNPFFADVWGFDLPFTAQQLAPFHDENNDGEYNPMDGDYPVVKLQGLPEFVPDMQIWQVVNDQGGGAADPVTNGKPLQAEIQITYFVFNCPDKPLINNAMFTSHKLINRANFFVDSFSLAMFVDFDLGCYSDDYVGCHPPTNTFYAYNRTNTDQTIATCPQVTTFGLQPPVQAVTFLNRSLDRFIPIYGASVGNPPLATRDPELPIEFFNYLHGHWRDGRPLTQGGSGYSTNPAATPVTHAFPGHPLNNAEWSMKSANQPGRDQRGLAIHEIGTILPGQIFELNTAWSYHRGPGLDYLGNVDLMLGEVPHLQDLYDGGFADVCATFVSTGEGPPGEALRVWPNPTSGQLYLRLPEPGSGLIRVFSQTGALISDQVFDNVRTIRLDTWNWPSGAYWVQVQGARGSRMARFIKQ